ncbi:MAG: universal stress protein [Desulfotomaculum sp.]|nr:universal stress protein [Desulfotomaculum sp.]
MYTLLLATDGSDNSLSAARKTLKMVEGRRNIKIYVLSVYKFGLILGGEAMLANITRDEITQMAIKEAQNALDKVMAVFENTNVAIETMVKEGETAQVIVETAIAVNADQIVMGTRGMGDIKGMLMGSVSRKVISLSQCPVLLVK